MCRCLASTSRFTLKSENMLRSGIRSMLVVIAVIPWQVSIGLVERKAYRYIHELEALEPETEREDL